MHNKIKSIMDAKLKDQDVLLVKEKNSNELKVIAGIDKGGNPKTVEAKQENEPSFLKIDKNGNVLDNFMSNFLRQYKDPTHFQFFRAPVDKVKEVIDNLQVALQKPDEPANKAVIELHKVETMAEEKKHAIDENRIDWSQLEKFGITRETLEKTKSLDAMLNWQKSSVLIPTTAKIDDTTLRTDARLSFRETPDGGLILAIHAIRKEPELERPYFGIRFTYEDKQNLLTTGNLGRVINVEYKQGEQTPVFISLDMLTNELVALRTDKFKIPETIKGVTLNNVQKKELSEGKAVLIEGMTSKNGKEFSASVQVNADKKGIEFRFDNQPKQVQQHGQHHSGQQNGGIRIPKTLLGVELSDKQRGQLQEGKTTYVTGMKDDKGEEFNAYVKVNSEKGKLDFFKWNPDKTTGVSAEKTDKTKVELNAENNIDEATKNVLFKGAQTEDSQKLTTKKQSIRI